MFEELNIYELRQLAREEGVHSPTKKKKKELIELIKKIRAGEMPPFVNKSNRGRPIKKINYDIENKVNELEHIILHNKYKTIVKEIKKLYNLINVE